MKARPCPVLCACGFRPLYYPGERDSGYLKNFRNRILREGHGGRPIRKEPAAGSLQAKTGVSEKTGSTRAAQVMLLVAASLTGSALTY